MLRIFLRRKVSSGKTKENEQPTKSFRPSKTRNRRLFERYNVSQQHLTILNEQDILVVREISAKGFSSDVSERAFLRFTKGDIYEARIRYMGEIFDLNVKVTWKRNKVVGFEIVNAFQIR